MIRVAVATASLALLQRAADPNPTLNSYTATASLSATLHAVVPIHETFNGTVYYLKPKRKIEFQNVPGPLSRFKDMAASTPSYEQATQQYAITPLSDNGSESSYALVPNKGGSRVKSLNVSVNDATALVTRAQWRYTDAGELTFDQAYVKIGGFELPLTFSDYAPNAAVSPSVFTS